MLSNTIVGLDCGATHTKTVVWKNEEVVFEVDNWPGFNMDLKMGGFWLEEFNKKIETLNRFENADWLIAMAGLDNEDEEKEAQIWWQRDLTALGIKYNKIKVISDIELVLWAGSPNGVGVGIIAGTGSNCLARDENGRTIKVGGMSHLLSDEGSGFALGWKCLRLVTKMSDGRLPKTKLYKDVLDLYGKKSIVDIKNLLVSSKEMKYEIARSAQVLLSAAENEDYAAEEVVDQESLELVLMINTANRMISPIKILDVFAAGSLFKNEYYFDRLKENLKSSYPDQKIKVVRPIIGVLNYFKHFDP